MSSTASLQQFGDKKNFRKSTFSHRTSEIISWQALGEKTFSLCRWFSSQISKKRKTKKSKYNHNDRNNFLETDQKVAFLKIHLPIFWDLWREKRPIADDNSKVTKNSEESELAKAATDADQLNTCFKSSLEAPGDHDLEDSLEGGISMKTKSQLSSTLSRTKQAGLQKNV